MGSVQCESPITLVAAEAITMGQAISVNSSGQAAVATASTSLCIGTAASDAASGGRVAVDLGQGRLIRGIASEAIAPNNKITCTTGGKWAVWSSGAGVKAVAITTAAADGDFFSLIIGVPWTA